MGLMTIQINNEPVEVNEGTTLEAIAKGRTGKKGAMIVAALVDHELRELTYVVQSPVSIQFVDLSMEDGTRIYYRSVEFLLIKAVKDLYPDRELVIRHSVSKGIFFDITGEDLGQTGVAKIEARMKQLVELNIPYRKVTLDVEQARANFLKLGREDRHRAIENREKDYVSLYYCDDVEDYFYGYMVPGTGYLTLFALEYFEGGIVLVLPKKEAPEQLPQTPVPGKLFNIFNEYLNWVRILAVDDIGRLNEWVDNGRINEFIRIAEALQEKKIAQIADQISANAKQIKMILIAGPSSSGKTTFAQRLSIQLRVNGLVPVNISVDDYFVNKDKTPRDDEGKPDYEALETVDLEAFNEDLKTLLAGGEINLPTFNFSKGIREYHGKKLKLDKDQVLVVEGIHGLNPRLTSAVHADSKFRIYISAITSMRIDAHNRIPTTDIRLIRRIVRDNQFRGTPALKTLGMWASVRRGEEKNIFPFQEEADVMFNSSLIYELGALKRIALPLLQELKNDVPEYAEARRLIEFLSYFQVIDSQEIPLNSLLREFLGGSCFS